MTTPRLVYDDDCGFCTWCAAFAARHGDFEPIGFAELTPEQRERLPDGWDNCAHLVTDEAVYSCGEAVEQTIARFGPMARRLVRAASRLPGYRRFRRRAYRWGAERRDWWGRIARRESV